MVIPPPNVTGSLHMGHALNTVLQDILARWKRMKGYNVLWVPGTDHAGIATQNVVEKQILSEGLDRYKLGREAFINRIWKWKSEYGGKIIHQLKKLGASCDWTRERFTLDEGLSKAVREVFVRLFEEGYIYRDNRLINWCPRCSTALSDLEVEYEEFEGKLTYIKYPFSDNPEKYITVATTRPETMLGDTAVAVNPDDKRYKNIIGKSVNLPLTNRTIPIIADSSVDPEFGTGAVKITPAHDFNDEAIAKRQNPPLPSISVIGEDGKMTDAAGERYKGLDRYECRKLVVKDLKELNLIEKEVNHKYALGHCYRCKTITEPLSTPQWYVKTKELASKAIEVVKKGRIRIIPNSWENTYFAWMQDIKDWCISRQIWWGHRIPIWYCKEQKNDTCKQKNGIIASRNDPTECPYCGSTNITQDEDVLDTWFSSALWPFSTLGWPEKTIELQKFYPTSVLVTGFDIIFFWVARMIMMGLKFMEEVPFRDVYIHALVRDSKGQKMSKSKGNVVDPLIMIDRYGTDAFRFALSAFAAQGRDIKFSEDRVEGYRHFVNKLWNASRFIISNTKAEEQFSEKELQSQSSIPSKWITSRLGSVAIEVNKALEEYRFNDAANSIYQFIWHELCDWYIETAKYDLQDNKYKSSTKWCLIYILDKSLRLLHPFMPFVTEEIWQNLKHTLSQYGLTETCNLKNSITISEFPTSLQKDYKAEKDMSYIIDAITGIRTIRGELNIHPSTLLNVSIKPLYKDVEEILISNIGYIKTLAKVDKIDINMHLQKPEQSAISVKSTMEIYIPLKGVLNVDAEMNRLKKEIKKVEASLSIINKKLINEDFLRRAPKEIVDKEKAKYEELLSIKDRIIKGIKLLKEIGGE